MLVWLKGTETGNGGCRDQRPCKINVSQPRRIFNRQKGRGSRSAAGAGREGRASYRHLHGNDNGATVQDIGKELRGGGLRAFGTARQCGKEESRVTHQERKAQKMLEMLKKNR